jgi:drug/metabolite transporter, DME family
VAHHRGPGVRTARGLAAEAWLGLVTTAAAHLLFVRGLRTVNAATAGTLSLAEPLVAAALALGLLHERLTATSAAGCLILVAGLAVTVVTPARQYTSREPPARAARRAAAVE